ncbi:MAG TPA: hypothetical protein VIG99_21390 [Myxococcaceae bacterium]
MHQRGRSQPLGTSLVELNLCSRAQVLAGLAAQAGLPLIDLDQQVPDRKLLWAWPREVAERYRAVPLRMEERFGILCIAVAAPASQERLEELRVATKARALQAFVATDRAIARAIERAYGPKQPAQTALLLYGWPPEDGEWLLASLAEQGIPGRIVSSSEALSAGPKDILLAPVTAMEALLQGARCRALLIAAAKQGEDFPRAERLDACSFVTAPLDMDCVVRAVQRCHQLLGARTQAAA